MSEFNMLLAAKVGLFVLAGFLAATGLVQIAKGGRRVFKMPEPTVGSAFTAAGGALPGGVAAILASGAVLWLATSGSAILANALPH